MKSPEWLLARLLLMTASKLWSIGHARFPKTQISNWRPPKCPRNKYTNHGERFEPKARIQLLKWLFEKYPNCQLFDAGMCLQAKASKSVFEKHCCAFVVQS